MGVSSWKTTDEWSLFQPAMVCVVWTLGTQEKTPCARGCGCHRWCDRGLQRQVRGYARLGAEMVDPIINIQNIESLIINKPIKSIQSLIIINPSKISISMINNQERNLTIQIFVCAWCSSRSGGEMGYATRPHETLFLPFRNFNKQPPRHPLIYWLYCAIPDGANIFNYVNPCLP